MKIVHLCFLGPFTEKWSYQDNLLTKHQSLNGHDVTIITGCFKHLSSGEIVRTEPCDYIIENNIRLIRVDYSNRILGKVTLLRKYKILKLLYKIKPDFIFCHGIGSLSYIQLRKFHKKYPACKLMADTHIYAELEDYGKSLRSKMGILYIKSIIKLTDRVFSKYYYVTPSCNTIATKYWRIDPKKTELLPLGYDDELIDIKKKKTNKEKLIAKYHLSKDSIIVSTGGKLNEEKNIHILTTFFSEYKKINPNTKIYLFVFGSFVEEWVKNLIMNGVDNKYVFYLGFLNQQEICDLYLSSDIAFFPGGQSVLWQCAIGCGLPLCIKKWDSIEYLDFNNNVLYLENLSKESFMDVFSFIDSPKINEYIKSALSDKRKMFSYDAEAKKVLLN